MVWHVEGSCNQCGECCKKLMRMTYMLKRPCCPDAPDNWCKYLFERDGKWLCEQREAYEEGDDEFFQLISQLDREYYLEECRDYPDPEKPAHTPPGHELLDVCGFKMVWVE